MMRMPQPWVKRILAGAALLVFAGGLAWAIADRGRDGVPAELRGVVVAEPLALAPVQLSDHGGGRVTEDWFSGRWTLVTFGFTHCPDVCPANLAQMGEIKKKLAQQYPQAPRPRFVFVSVDPQRDTPATLATYMAAFDREFIGLTGAPAQIEALAQPFAAFHRSGTPTAAGDYRVTHSSEIFLVDPSGRVYARFTPPLDPALAARQLNTIMTLYAESGGREPAPRS